jgi:hypothetical protein
MFDFLRIYASLETIVDNKAPINPHKTPKRIKKHKSAVLCNGSIFSETNKFMFFEAALKVFENIMHKVAQENALTKFFTK